MTRSGKKTGKLSGSASGSQMRELFNKIFSLPAKILEMENGKSLRFLAGWLLRLGSAGILFASGKLDYSILSTLHSKMTISAFVGNISTVLGSSFTAYIGAGLLFLRSNSLLSASQFLEYPILFLFVEIIQIVAEILGVMIMLISTVAGVVSLAFSALGDNGAFGFAPFISGLYGWAALYYFFSGVAMFLVGHAIREFLTILIRIEKNTR